MAASAKGVHWGAEPSFGSDASSEILSTSSLDYINSQLVAHGFAPAPGLSLDALANTHLERTVKCLLGMLGQRVDDMARTEDLTTKLRTLSYDHERLVGMYRTATDAAANAEREANVHKSRLAAETRLRQASESAHKQTTAELQRARTALQAVRATHQAELKKKERDVERMAERWGRLADMQAKAAAAPSGLKCANLKIADGTEVPARGAGLEERALEDAERARQLLSEENGRLRALLLGAVNEAQAMLYHAGKEEESVPLTLLTLFPMAPQDAAHEKLTTLLAALRGAIARPTAPTSTVSTTPSTSPVPEGELTRLQGIIDGLKVEIEHYRQESVTRAAQTQAMFDEFANDPRVVEGGADASVELMIAPARDEEKERLEKIKVQLEMERTNFTEAALKLGRERAALEAERMTLADEKRSWEVDKMLAELPPTPNPALATDATTGTKKPLSPRKSPRKSPAKGPAPKVFTVGKTGAHRKTTTATSATTRVSRRSSLSPPPRSKAQPKFQPAFETEVLPALAFASGAASSLLPTSFVLPPPSPGCAFPPAPALVLSSAPDLLQPSAAAPAVEIKPESESGPATPPNARRPFPMAKPLAPRMIHAYSPAKPSPLSRILMWGNESPATPDIDGVVLRAGGELGPGDLSTSLSLPALPEEGDLDLLTEEPLVFPALLAPPRPPVPAPARELTLAEELGVSESPPDSPEVPPPAPVPARARAGPGRFTAVEKGKGRAVEAVRTEKENGAAAGAGSQMRRKIVPLQKAAPGGSAGASAKGRQTVPAQQGGGSVRARVTAKLPPPSSKPATGGARRVLVDSAEAPSVPRGWRG